MARRKKIKIVEPDPELKAFRAKKGELQGKLTAEQARVEAARKAVLANAQRAYEDYDYRGQVLTHKLPDYSSYCSTRSCELESASGYTVPSDITVNNRSYKPGDKIPIIPGTRQFSSMADKLGYQTIPPSQIQPGDRVMLGHGGNINEAYHSMIAGNPNEQGKPTYYWDSGSGNDFKTGMYEPYNIASGYRYVGAVPRIKAEIDAHRKTAADILSKWAYVPNVSTESLKSSMAPQSYASRIPLPQVPLKGQASTMTPDQRKKARAKRRRIAEA